MGPRRILLVGALVVLALSMAGDIPIHAASCKPLKQGTCNVCKNCRYCGHCAKAGGTCTVCKR